MESFYVNLSPKQAADIVSDYVMNSGMSVKIVDSCGNISPNGAETIMLVFEKYFMRNSSRASLSVMIENINGRTAVYSIGSGGGQGIIFGFDWGAADSFANLAGQALERYVI